MVIFKIFNVVIFFLVLEEKIFLRREDDLIFVNREFVNLFLVCDKKICFFWDDSVVDVVFCLLSKGEVLIFKGFDDCIIFLIEDSVEGVVLFLGVFICWIFLVVFCDVIFLIGDEVVIGCDVLISDSVDFFLFGKYLFKCVIELLVFEFVEWFVVLLILCIWIVVVIVFIFVVEVDFILNLVVLFFIIEIFVVIVLFVFISMVCGCEVDGCVVFRYSGIVDLDFINSDRKLEI